MPLFQRKKKPVVSEGLLAAAKEVREAKDELAMRLDRILDRLAAEEAVLRLKERSGP